MTKPLTPQLAEVARRYAKDSIVMDATARLITQVLTEVHETQIEPLRRRIAELEAALQNPRNAP